MHKGYGRRSAERKRVQTDCAQLLIVTSSSTSLLHPSGVCGKRSAHRMKQRLLAADDVVALRDGLVAVDLQVRPCGSGGERQTDSLASLKSMEDCKWYHLHRCKWLTSTSWVGCKGSFALGLVRSGECGDDPRPSAEEGTVMLQQLVCYPLLEQNQQKGYGRRKEERKKVQNIH